MSCQAQFAGCFRQHKTFFDGDGHRADGPVAAHGQTAAGFNKQHTHIIRRVDRRIKDAARHHIVPPWLKHQSLANPVELAQEMQPALAHRGAM